MTALDLARWRPYLPLAIVVVALLGVRALSAIVVSQPGYTDAYYYATVASRLARGEGLTADFVWNFLEAPQFTSLPIASHRFWMPLATLAQAAGIVLAGGPLGDFRASQLAIVVVAAAIPVVTYAAARSLGAGRWWSLAAAAVAGLGGLFAPAWVSLDSFALAAVIGTGFFLAYARAARGSVRAGIAAGALVGLLYLARAEGALFGLALIALLGWERSRRAGAFAMAVALAIGIGWLARNALLAFPQDLFARATLLLRYEDLYAIAPPTLARFISAPDVVIGSRVDALVTNALTALMTLLLVLSVPIWYAARAMWRRVEVRAFVALFALVYLTQSLLFAPHSVRGSFFHSVASFFPFGIALAAVGGEALMSRSPRGIQRAAVLGAVLAFAAISAGAVIQWGAAFDPPYHARLAALPLLRPGAVIAVDAPAWRWISGREVVVSPADGPRAASCAAEIYLAGTLVLEPVHFSTYDDMYATGRSDHFTFREERGGIKLFEPRTDQRCIIAATE